MSEPEKENKTPPDAQKTAPEEKRAPALEPQLSTAPSVPFSASMNFFRHMDLREQARLLKRRLKIVVRLTALFAFLGFLVSLLLTPQYKADVVMMLDPARGKIMDLGEAVSNMGGDNAALRSEIDIISSRAVIDRVMKKLSLIDDTEFSKPTTNLLDLLPLKNILGLEAPEEPEDAKVLAQENWTRAAENVKKHLDVSNDGRSRSIHLSFTSRDPRKAARIANTFAAEYLVDQLEAKYEIVARANKWLSERLETLRKKVETSERAVEAYRQRANLIQVDGSTVASRQLDEINTQLITARAATSQAEARLRNAQAMVQSGSGIDGSTDVLSSPLIQRLREQEAEVRRKEAELATRYGERHPKMINARAQRRDLQHKIQEEVQKILRSLAGEVQIARAKERQLQQDLSTLESKAGKELRASVQLRQLQREADANKMLYENFLARFKETSEQRDMQLPDTRIIAHADVPVSPSFPKTWLFLVVGALLGGMIGVGAAYVIEFLDRGYRTAPQLEEGTGLPVVGQIPSTKKITKVRPEKYVIDKPMSAYTEALRTVRTALHFSNVDNPPKSVMVTSSGPGEGKTTFCLSLARSLAAGGHKVLLIDGDLRKPSIARSLGIKANDRDLASLLTGKYKMPNVVRKDPLTKTLDIVPSFGRTPNAQDILSSKQMKRFMSEVKKRYDLVIVDTPPILAVADAAMIARVVDSNLFVVKWADTARDTVTQALQQLKTFDCRMAGVVLSQVNMTELASYGEGYHSQRYHAYYLD